MVSPPPPGEPSASETTVSGNANEPHKQNNNQSTKDVDVDTLRNQRERAFREVDYISLAKQEAVSGYSTLVYSSPSHDSADSSTVVAMSSSCFNTPLIDISSLHGGSEDTADATPEQSQLIATTYVSTGASSFLSPQAGLHRDGEQARIVELVRQRQLQQQIQQQRSNKESTYQWFEESLELLWNNVTTLGGYLESDAQQQQTQQVQSAHYAEIVNPYRDSSHTTLRSTMSSFNQSTQSTSKETIDTPSSSSQSSLSNRPRIVRMLLYIYLRVLYVMRLFIDGVITRIGRLEPFPEQCPTLGSYSTTPTYSIQFTADDVIRVSALVLALLWCSCRLQIVLAPAVSIMFFFGIMIRCKVVGRLLPANNQHQTGTLIEGSKMETSTISVAPRITTTALPAAKAHHLEAVQRLKKRYPNATDAECKRFFDCVKCKEDEAAQRIESWLKWRKECGLKLKVDESDASTKEDLNRSYTDEFVGKRSKAATLALELSAKNTSASYGSLSTAAVSIKLPQILCSYEYQLEGTNNNTASTDNPPPRCKDGSRILHIIPARLDMALAPASVYSLACALYLERRLSRSSTERIALICDVRGGRGWSNPTPWSMLPFIQSSKVVVVGVAEDGRKFPEKLNEWIADESLDILEERRRSLFIV
ncbi:predicted protein [Thalassiosira pseudonana CCMP1335]|uniref:CRAL-TRIO domain-containing protein n=1 Tax=Thalassiosira pseudonana TaxID=35128 RepID=B8BS32_THAPS|nr:predicted protein [Thalassiosira pseudonana CCMP1335]EED96056.1 predicted protein [Thalassiosira pseudonana CCMP1335]